MRIVIISLSFFCLSSFCLAEDPGLQDSIIVETVFLELGQTSADIDIYARTDDDVAFYQMPITWYSQELYSIYPESVSHHNTMLLWDDYGAYFLYDEGLIRMLGFSDIGGETNPPLNTGYNREHCWTLHFTIDPIASPQIVVIDTVTDPVWGTFLFGLEDGVTSFVPAYVPGAIYYGVTSDNSESIHNIPYEFSLSQNYPNPFNAQTTIEITLPMESEIELAVYDLLARKVAVLFEGIKAAGTHSMIWNAKDVPSGIYFYQLSSEGYSQFNKMTLIR